MDYKQLKFFRKVCEEKSINRAARKLFISQQALSQSIARLEQELGVALLVRTPGGVRLTPAGQLLEQRAGAYLEEHDDILRQLQSAGAGAHLRVGYFMGLLQELPPHFFGRFMDAHPEVQFHFRSYTDTVQGRTYQNEDCDLVITTAPMGQSMAELAHLENRIGVMMAAQNPLADRPKLFLEDLKGTPLISLNTENRSQGRLLEKLGASGLVIDTVLGDADGELIGDLIRRGYISFYAGKRSALPQGVVFRFLEDLHLYWEFYIYGRRGHRLTELERELVREILAAVSSEEGET